LSHKEEGQNENDAVKPARQPVISTVVNRVFVGELPAITEQMNDFKVTLNSYYYQ